MKRRLAFFVLLLVLFLSFFVWRIAWFPYRPDLLRGAIPPQATLVSEHLHLGERWADTVSHPLVRALLQVGGVEAEALDDLGTDAGTRAVVDRLAARHVVLAQVPALGLEQQPAWVFASWAGFQGQLMRWGVYNSILRDFEPRQFSGGRKGWVLLDSGPDFGHMPLSLVVIEGVLLGCLSPDPDALSILIYRVENRVPPLPALTRVEHALDPVHGPWDHVLMGGLGDEYTGTGGDDAVWSAAWTLDSPTRASGTVRGPADGAWGITASNRLELAALGRLIGNSAAALLVAPTHVLAAVEGGDGMGDGVRVLWRRLFTLAPPGGQGFLMIGAPDQSGRMMGIRVASMIGGFPVAADDAEVQRVVGEALAAFNGRFDTTLRSRPTQAGLFIVNTIDSERSGPLSSLSDKERPCYFVHDGWFLFASNRSALEKVLAQGGVGSEPPWVDELSATPSSSALWIDLAATGDAVGKVVAVLDLVALLGGRNPDALAARQRLSSVRDALAIVGDLRVTRAWGDATSRLFELHIDVGDPAPARPATR